MGVGERVHERVADHVAGVPVEGGEHRVAEVGEAGQGVFAVGKIEGNDFALGIGLAEDGEWRAVHQANTEGKIIHSMR